MKIVIDIPNELALAVIRCIEDKESPDDDGYSCARIMSDLNLSVDQFTKADWIANSIVDKIEEAIRIEDQGNT